MYEYEPEVFDGHIGRVTIIDRVSGKAYGLQVMRVTEPGLSVKDECEIIGRACDYGLDVMFMSGGEPVVAVHQLEECAICKCLTPAIGHVPTLGILPTVICPTCLAA